MFCQRFAIATLLISISGIHAADEKTKTIRVFMSSFETKDGTVTKLSVLEMSDDEFQVEVNERTSKRGTAQQQ